MRYLSQFCLLGLISVSTISLADSNFLTANQAFQLSAESLTEKKVQLQWKIAPEYYLYHQQFKVTANNRAVPFLLPKGQIKNDPTFGITEVHYNQVRTEINVLPNTNYKVIWQGCAKDGLCYPIQTQTLSTDSDGLIPQQMQRGTDTFANPKPTDQFNSLNTNGLSQDQSITTDSMNAENALTLPKKNSELPSIAQNHDFQNSVQPLNNKNDDLDAFKQNATSESTIKDQKSTEVSYTTSLQWNDDQTFFKLLSQNSIFINLFVFFILGILLAFLPCSLPLIPILSTLIIQRHTGYKAVVIALSFVLSMAFIYSLMGVFVAEIGYSFQRWFQSPLIISLFAILFVLFALNLFGLFQLALPQTLIQKINDLQNRQKTGTVLGAVIMGALSALIVGPCMSAPLAGALLFVSQSQSAFLGGVYLFILGCGLGLPLFLASVFGTKLLPKPGIWMNHLKVCFGFLMLMMALYFIRPLISSHYYDYAFAIICFALLAYLIKVLKNPTHILGRLSLIFLSMTIFIFGAWNVQQGLKSRDVERLEQNLHIWKKVSKQSELNHAMQQAHEMNLPIVIDVYANWCAACQPLKKDVFPRADVQQALKDFYLIELDLSNYHESQDLILKEHEILGPPTILFFDPSGHEMRQLRLTGTFKANQLIQQLQRVKAMQK